MELKSKLSMFKNNKSSTSWTGHIRGSPLKWKKLDGENVVKAIKYAEKNPIRKSINSKKLNKKPQVLKTQNDDTY